MVSYIRIPRIIETNGSILSAAIQIVDTVVNKNVKVKKLFLMNIDCVSPDVARLEEIQLSFKMLDFLAEILRK